MKITHLGHAAVLVETSEVRILIDPGNFSTSWHDLEDVDAVLVTHSHPDHIDPEWIPALISNNPKALWFVEPSVPDLYDLPPAERFPADSVVMIGDARIEGVGGRHAIIHRDIPQIGNVGMVIRGDGEVFFHPGDELDTIPEGVDVLATPAHGPWCAMKETIDFVRAVGASQGFLIHEGLINERGWDLTFSRMQEMTDTAFTDLRGHALIPG